MRASRTAVLVCQARAVADGRPDRGPFSDPVARRLLHDDELATVERVLSGEESTNAAGRAASQMVQSTARVIAPRTVAIDEAVSAHPAPQVVLLGAGLDARAYRLGTLAERHVFEVDHPASQADKLDRVGALSPVCARLAHAAVDLAVDPLGPALADAGHRAGVPTTWVWEGVVPYLAPRAVATTVEQVAALSAPGSRLVVNYQQSSVRARAGRILVGALMRLSRADNPFVGEPWRSTWTPESLAGLLAEHGFTVVDDLDLLTLASRHGLDAGPGAGFGSLRNGRVAVATR